jgi:predicted transcriptional regulator
MIKTPFRLILTIILFVMLFNVLNAEDIRLKQIVLNGKKGGYADGKIWTSNSLIGRTNVIIYVDPDNFSDIKQFVSYLEAEKSINDNFGLTFIVNTASTVIPNFAIRSKIRSRAKESSKVSYVLDNDKSLIENWNLRDDSANVLVLDSSNRQRFLCSGNISSEDSKNIMGIINNSYNKEQ